MAQLRYPYDVVRQAMVVSLLLVAGCGAPRTESTANLSEQRVEAGRCTSDVVLIARALPEEEDCDNEDVIDSLITGCGTEDPSSCFRLATCIELQLPPLEDLDDSYAVDAAVGQLLQPLAVSCRGGIAAGCQAHASLLNRVISAHHQRRDATELKRVICDDMVRACHLDSAACSGCIAHGCAY